MTLSILGVLVLKFVVIYIYIYTYIIQLINMTGNNISRCPGYLVLASVDQISL